MGSGARWSNMDFTNKVIVVTGGASGIGQATAREFATRNGAVAIFDRNDQAGRETADALCGAGRKVEYFHVDLAVGAQVEQAVERSEEHTSELQSLRHLVC